MAKMKHRRFDAIIVGAGGSGLRAAYQLAQEGKKVAVLSKVFPTRSHTVAAQGGVGASLGNMSEDNWYWHMFDTVKGSDYLGDQDAIEVMCKEAADRVYELEHWGMPFDRNADGTIYQRPFGGHTANFGEKPVQRACAAADRTGHALLHTLYQSNVRAKTQFFVEWLALDLIMHENQVLGVSALEMETGEVWVLEAQCVLLCTGGAGRIWRASTNAYINTGDGLGMCARAGIPLEDMEFWQFHPTGVAGAGVLITEGVRGEGGILLNKNNERFMERYAPVLKDLAPRDFVSRSMDQEIKQGRGAGAEGDFIWLKLSHLGADVIEKRLPSIREIAIKFANVDPIKEMIPVVPTIHYQMGGIPTDINGRVLNKDNQPVQGLYAAGECACVSVHGANRLGTNSLLDLLVFGKRTGDALVNALKKEATQTNNQLILQQAFDQANLVIDKLMQNNTGIKSSQVVKNIQDTMQDYCGVFRTESLLSEGVEKIKQLTSKVGQVSINDKSKVFNLALVEALELRNMIHVAQSTIESAYWRRESRGAHSRDDFPERDDKDYLIHTLWTPNKILHKPVVLKGLTVDGFVPKKRTF